MEEMIVGEEKKYPSLLGAEPIEKAKAIYMSLYNKKARNIKVFVAKGKTEITDFVVIATGTSSTHVKALAGEVEYQMDLREVKVDNFEGRDNGAWVVLDYSSVMVHVMSRESREFYDLEKLFDGAEELDLRPVEDESENN